MGVIKKIYSVNIRNFFCLIHYVRQPKERREPHSIQVSTRRGQCNVSRRYSGRARAAVGSVRALFYAAFGAFECKKRGKIPRSEFPSGVQAKMAVGNLIMVIVAIYIAIGAIALLGSTD